MHTRQIWDCDSERMNLWTTDPARAAMLAYLEVVALWHDQVDQGMYWGIPALHRLPNEQLTREIVQLEPATSRSRPARYMPDDSAQEWVVPVEIRERWLRAA